MIKANKILALEQNIALINDQIDNLSSTDLSDEAISRRGSLHTDKDYLRKKIAFLKSGHPANGYGKTQDVEILV